MWFKKALGGVLVFFIAACIVLPRTKIAQDFVRARLLPWYEQALGCSVSCDKLSFSLVFPSLELSTVTLSSLDKGAPWRCECQRIQLSTSWVGFIVRRLFNLSILLDHPVITSAAHGEHVAFIEDHVQRYFSGPPSLPLAFKALTLRHADVRVHDTEYGLEVHTLFSAEYKKMHAGYGINLHCEDGSIRYGTSHIMHSLSGYWQSSLAPVARSIAITGHGRGEFVLFQGEQAERCYWEGKTTQGDTTVSAWRAESEDIGTVHINKEVVDATLSLSLSRIAEHIIPPAYTHKLKGELKGMFHARRDQGLDKGELSITLSDGAYGSHELFKELLFVVPPRTDNSLHGDLTLTLHEREPFAGSWSWEPQTHTGTARLVTAAGVELGSITLMPDSACKGGYHVTILQRGSEGGHGVKADVRYHHGALSLHAERGKEQLFLEGKIGDSFDISLLRWLDESQKALIDLSYDSAEKHRITGLIDVGAIQRLAKRFWGIAIHGEGSFEVRGHYADKRYSLTLEGSKLAVRLPRIYNVINGLTGTFVVDPYASTLALSDVRCTLHRGSCSISQAHIHYDPAEEVVVYTIPLSLASFWFNVEKDLYALLSGELQLTRTGATVPLLSGEVIVERAHVSESILTLPALQKARPKGILEESSMYPLGLNIKVRSKNPIQIALARLEGAAHIAMQIGNTLAEPTLSGIIRLDSGKVVFPYKPLMLRKAQLIFNPQQSYDPTVELFAKNRIKGYDVSLTLQGTLSSHDMRLQSTPPLSDEQLIGLLYAGSEQGALGALVPSMVMRNITSMFSKNSSESSSQGVDKNSWRERLKRIRLVPSLTDQHGRGGLRGTLEVDINDRWRALMQKNFSLSEDTRFELDYDLSDDVSLRALRDERRDLGAEVEMKVKF